MTRSKNKVSAALLDQMLGEASWLLSHAQALADYGREEEAAAERVRAAKAAEEAAGLLDADGQELEAAIQRVSAASCHEKLGQYAQAVTLLRAALSAPLHDDHRARVEQLLMRCLAQTRRQMRKASPRKKRARPAAAS